jgi:hypothetical protein
MAVDPQIVDEDFRHQHPSMVSPENIPYTIAAARREFE